MGRSPCCSKDSVNRGAWSAAEDSLLTKYIETHGEGGWRSLPKKAGLRRCGKSCRLRWLNYLRPNIKRGNISPDEEELIIRMHGLLGNRWSLIAGRVPGRTDNEIKNYWNTYLSKKLAFEGLNPKTHKPILDSRDKDESRPAITMTSRCINPLKSRTAARSGSVLFEIPDDHDKNINRECPKQSDLKYDPKVADDRHNFLSSFSVQINDDPSSYSHPPDYNCSPKDVDNTLTAGPDDNLIDVEVISSPGLDMIVSPLPEVHNLSSADNLHSNSMSLFKSTSDFASSSDIVKTTNDLSYFNATVSDLHDQPVMPLVKIDCPLQESADQINSHTSTGVVPVLAASDHIEHDKKDKINVHADQKTNVLDVLSFFEVGDAEKEMCCNRVDPDWEQDRYPHLEADTASMCHGLMHQLKWDDHDCLQLQGDQTGSCSPDYGLTDGAMWEALLWHEE